MTTCARFPAPVIPSATTSPICPCLPTAPTLRLVVSQEFTAPAASRTNHQRLWLHFGGINYRGEIWLNGHKIADSDAVAGAYRTYDFDITESLKPGKQNVLAVETICADGKGSRHQLGRLESLPARQGHGPVGRGRPGHNRPGDGAFADGGHSFLGWRIVHAPS